MPEQGLAITCQALFYATLLVCIQPYGPVVNDQLCADTICVPPTSVTAVEIVAVYVVLEAKGVVVLKVARPSAHVTVPLTGPDGPWTVKVEVVTELLFIASLKFAVTLLLVATPVEPL